MPAVEAAPRCVNCPKSPKRRYRVSGLYEAGGTERWAVEVETCTKSCAIEHAKTYFREPFDKFRGFPKGAVLKELKE